MLVHLLQKYFLKIVAFVSKTIIELGVLCYNQTMCEVDQFAIKWFRFRPKITIVTYAHSPQALELTPKVIKKAKKILQNSLLVRFEHLYKSLILLVFHFLEQKTSIRN